MIQKIYCGPNILKYGIMRYQVFIGEGYAVNVSEAIAGIPEIENLFCEIGELESMRSRVADVGSAEHLYYSVVEQKARELSKS